MESPVKKDLLEKIIKQIEESLPCLNQPGLLSGKMGVAIFFLHYANLNLNRTYEDIGLDLINSAIEDINGNTPIDYEKGFAGIGTGLEYLIQHLFIDGDSNDILSDSDNWIFRELYCNTEIDPSLNTGLLGIGKYYVYRLKGQKNWQDNLQVLKNRQNIIYLLDRLDRPDQVYWDDPGSMYSILLDIYQMDIFNVRVEALLRYYLSDNNSGMEYLIRNLSKQRDDKKRALSNTLFNKASGDISRFDPGLKNGLAGIGLSLLAQQYPDCADWIDLII